MQGYAEISERNVCSQLYDKQNKKLFGMILYYIKMNVRCEDTIIHVV